MSRIDLLLLTAILLVISAPLTSNSQPRARKADPVKRKALPPLPKEVVAVKTPVIWNPVFTGQVSSLHTGKAGDEVFALTDSSLYRSGDYGKDWSLLFSLPSNLPVPETPYTTDTFKWKLVFQQSKSDPQVMYLAAIGHHSNLTTSFYAGSLWKSVNGGKDWQHLNYNSLVSGSMPGNPRYKKGQGSVVSSLAISPRNANTLYMTGVENRLYKSLNGGENWTDITPDAMSPFRISINPHDAENMYLLNGVWDPLETTDGGSTWHKLKYDLSLLITASPGYAEDNDRRWTWITFHPDMPQRMLGIVNSHLVASDDGGRSWKDISFVTAKYNYRSGVQGYKISPISVLGFSGTASDTLYVSLHDGVYKSVDFGKTWSLLFQESALDFVVSKNDKKILAATKLGTFQASEDYSKWTKVGTSLPPVVTTELSAVDTLDSPLYLIKSNGDLIKSFNSFDWEWERNPSKRYPIKRVIRKRILN